MALISCPACARRVSEQAASCPQCGHPIHQPVEAVQPPVRPRREWFKALTLSVVSFAAVLLVLNSFTADSGNRPGPNTSTSTSESRSIADQSSDLAAAHECRRLIQEQLGPLRSADFPPVDSATVERRDAGGTVAVRSYMDLLSTRGEPLHTTYTCTLRSAGPGSWEMVSLSLP